MEKIWLQRFAQGAEGAAEGAEAAPAEAQGTEEQPSLPERQGETQQEAPREPDPMVERHWRRVDAIYDGWMAQAMRTGAYRPGENGLDSGASALTGRNVTKMTRQDYDRVCRMVERGERVSFG